MLTLSKKNVGLLYIALINLLQGHLVENYQLKSISVFEGSSAKFICSVAGSKVKFCVFKYYNSAVTDYLNDGIWKDDTNAFIQRNGADIKNGECEFMLNSVNVVDTGKWRCELELEQHTSRGIFWYGEFVLHVKIPNSQNQRIIYPKLLDYSSSFEKPFGASETLIKPGGGSLHLSCKVKDNFAHDSYYCIFKHKNKDKCKFKLERKLSFSNSKNFAWNPIEDMCEENISPVGIIEDGKKCEIEILSDMHNTGNWTCIVDHTSSTPLSVGGNMILNMNYNQEILLDLKYGCSPYNKCGKEEGPCENNEDCFSGFTCSHCSYYTEQGKWDDYKCCISKLIFEGCILTLILQKIHIIKAVNDNKRYSKFLSTYNSF